MFNTKASAAGLSIASNSALIILKVAAGLAMGSVSVISEAIHSGVDLLAAVIAFFSIRVAARPADEQHPFGHGKVENVSGVVEGSLIFLAAALIIYEALEKIRLGVEVESLGMGMVVMFISVVVNVLVSRRLLSVARASESIALEADARHLTTDVYTSLGVLAGLAAVQLTGIHVLDPFTAIGVALIILWTAYRVTGKAFADLLDARLPHTEEARISSIILEHYGELVGFHDLRTRKSGSERYIDLHLVIARNTTIEEAHKLCDHLESDIRTRLPHSSVNIHEEPCEMPPDRCPASCPLVKKAHCYPLLGQHPSPSE